MKDEPTARTSETQVTTASAPASRTRLFLAAALPDALLVLAASAALIAVVGHGFYSGGALSQNLALDALFALPFVAVTFAGSWSKKAVLPAVAGYGILAAAALGLALLLTPGNIPVFENGAVNDVAANLLPFAAVVVVVPALVYLPSRRPLGAAFAFVAGTAACAVIAFLYREWAQGWFAECMTALTLWALGAQIIYQAYRSAAASADWLGRPGFGRVLGLGLGISAACLALGALLFAVVINPIGLVTPEIKPFQESFSRPVVEYTGVFDKSRVTSLTERTDSLNDEQEDTRENTEGGSEASEGEGAGEDPTPLEALASLLTGYDSESWQERYRSIGYAFATWGVLGLLLVAAALLGAVFWRRSRRGARIRALGDRSNAYKIAVVYQFLLGRFRMLGLEEPGSLTPLEFAMAARRDMVPYTKGTDGVDFVAVTLAYQRAAFGDGQVSDEDWERVRRYYDAFFANARRVSGPWRWLVRFWRI